MANLLQQAGAGSEPSSFAPLHTNRIFTGLWTNRSPLRDAATSDYQERAGMSRQDSILTGYNSEITPRLTLRRRWGNGVYNPTPIPPVNRFYSFNTFTLTNEIIRVMADTGKGGGVVYDATAPTLTPIFTKSAGADTTYFLGVGNTLYFTNGVDNKQVTYDPATGTWSTVIDWGIVAPTTAPSVNFPFDYDYGRWLPLTVFARNNRFAPILIIDTNGNIQNVTHYGKTGTGNPAWATGYLLGTTDGAVGWQNMGTGAWAASVSKGVYDLIYRTASDGKTYFYQAQVNGATGSTEPIWLPGLSSVTQDNAQRWLNLGQIMYRDQIGDQTPLVGDNTILDPTGGVQNCIQAGKTGATAPNFNAIKTGYTSDPTAYPIGAVVWQNAGAVGVVQYGYAFMNSTTGDISNMSPPSVQISTNDGQEVIVQGTGSTQAGMDTIIIYRTTHGGATFLYDAQIPNTGGAWSYNDTTLDADLNAEWQAYRGGEGTPLPSGATALGYHLGRIFAAVGNVVYISSGPDAIAGTSSGNAGFDTTFTAQSKITRFWTCSLGMVVFTVRDAYIVLGSATDADPLYMVVFIEQLPLLHYDAFTINKTTPLMMLGNSMVIALDPSAGIVEVGFPIADRFEEEFDPSKAFVTFHSESSRETALYVANGNGYWYRMNSNNAPEQGSAWSTRANIAGMGCVQSVEVTPGVWRLLWTNATANGPIMQRQKNAWTDNGTVFPVRTVFGNIVAAHPGQLAALSFITLESARVGTRAGLALLLGEIFDTPSVPFDVLKRTRQDPPDLPQSQTLFSDRYHFEQNQKTAWCRHFQMEITWPAEDASNELLTYTIFGQTWQEFRSQ